MVFCMVFRALEEAKQHALNTWNNRVRICFGLQLISAGCLLRSYYWFTTVIGFAMLLGCYVYSYIVKQKKHEFALAVRFVCVAVIGAG